MIVVLVQLLRELKDSPIDHDLYAVFTTQEEVGTRGGRTAGYALEPDLAIALDVTMTGDIPYAQPAMDVGIGKGVAIKVLDSGMVGHPGLGMTDVPSGSVVGLKYQPTVHVNYGEKVMAMRDGLPKFKDFPKEFGGSGEMLPE